MLSRCVCAVALMGIAFGLARFADADPLTVKTTQGKVHGRPINDGKVRAFFGIPYATPPVGDSALEAAANCGEMEGRARRDQVRRALHAGSIPRYELSGCGHERGLSLPERLYS